MLENRKTAIKNKVLLMEGFFFFFWTLWHYLCMNWSKQFNNNVAIYIKELFFF